MKHPNILFIPIDDLRPQLGCYGHQQMKTPHMDGLASEGTVFKQAYCQVPVCGASRASLLTGRRPTRTRFLDFLARVDDELPDALTLPQYFRENGYETVSVGKVFHHGDDTSERSWSIPPWRPHSRKDGAWRNYLTREAQGLAKSENGAGPPYECADVADNGYWDGQIADRAVAELGRLRGREKPFFLAAGFLKPHLPFNAPKRYWDLYRTDDIHIADNPFAPENAPDRAIHNWGELRKFFSIPKEGPVSEETARRLVHGYYACTSYTDAQVGRLLKALKDFDLMENTIVVVWGDHGWQLGEHGMWSKHCTFETSLNAPLIFHVPDQHGGVGTEAIVEFLDIFPTLCDLSGLKIPTTLQGKSLVPMLDDPNARIKEAAYCRWWSAEAVRTENYLYTEWLSEQGERMENMMYDHNSDPNENVNIAVRNEYAESIERFSGMLATIRQED